MEISAGWFLIRSRIARDGVYYDLVAQVEMEQWSRGRVALIGDACCAVSLLAGQGASVAMGAAYVLADELLHARAVPKRCFGTKRG